MQPVDGAREELAQLLGGAGLTRGADSLLCLKRQTYCLAIVQLVDGALEELAQLLGVAGLPVTLTPIYARPVAGYTLEAQLRSALGLPEIKYPVPSPPVTAALPPGSADSSGGGGVSGAAVGGIVAGMLVAVGLFAGILGSRHTTAPCFVNREIGCGPGCHLIRSSAASQWPLAKHGSEVPHPSVVTCSPTIFHPLQCPAG